MSPWSILGAVVLLLAGTGAAIAARARAAARRSDATRRNDAAPAATRILFPFTAHALLPQALAATLRIARAEQAVVVPVFLARVSLDLPLDAPIPQQSSLCLPLQDLVEQEAARVGVPVEARIERGRTERHALQRAIEHERFDRLVLAAAVDGAGGLRPDDVAWALTRAPGEIVVIRPAHAPTPAPGSRSLRQHGPARPPESRLAGQLELNP